MTLAKKRIDMAIDQVEEDQKNPKKKGRENTMAIEYLKMARVQIHQRDRRIAKTEEKERKNSELC